MENLTYLQKVALKGEIAYALTTSNHTEDVKFRTFLLLREIEDQYRNYTMEVIKDIANFDEDELNRIYLEAMNNRVPVWLWVEKSIADIKLALNIGDSGALVTGRLKVEKKDAKKAIIESSFISYIRDCIMVSPRAAEELCLKVMEDDELDFLHTSCFYLLSGCQEMKIMDKEENGIHPNILTQSFNIRDLLSFTTEIKALEKITKKPKFFVRKVYNGTEQGTILREFDSEDEARAFKEKIEREYPELKRTCTFEIIKGV